MSFSIINTNQFQINNKLFYRLRIKRERERERDCNLFYLFYINLTDQRNKTWTRRATYFPLEFVQRHQRKFA